MKSIISANMNMLVAADDPVESEEHGAEGDGHEKQDEHGNETRGHKSERMLFGEVQALQGLCAAGARLSRPQAAWSVR